MLFVEMQIRRLFAQIAIGVVSLRSVCITSDWTSTLSLIGIIDSADTIRHNVTSKFARYSPISSHCVS